MWSLRSQPWDNRLFFMEGISLRNSVGNITEVEKSGVNVSWGVSIRINTCIRWKQEKIYRPKLSIH